MSNSTLFLIQSSFHRTPSVLQQVHQIYIQGDCLIFMGESLTALNKNQFQHVGSAYYLDVERALLTESLAQQMTSLSYAEFADISLKFNRCVSLK